MLSQRGQGFKDLCSALLYPGSSPASGGMAVDECASVWPGCRPTGASGMVPRALPVGLH
jgi:hypothetical protein